MQQVDALLRNFITIEELAQELNEPRGRIAYWVDLLNSRLALYGDTIPRWRYVFLLRPKDAEIIRRVGYLYKCENMSGRAAVDQAIKEKLGLPRWPVKGREECSGAEYSERSASPSLQNQCSDTEDLPLREFARRSGFSKELLSYWLDYVDLIFGIVGKPLPRNSLGEILITREASHLLVKLCLLARMSEEECNASARLRQALPPELLADLKRKCEQIISKAANREGALHASQYARKLGYDKSSPVLKEIRQKLNAILELFGVPLPNGNGSGRLLPRDLLPLMEEIAAGVREGASINVAIAKAINKISAALAEGPTLVELRSSEYDHQKGDGRVGKESSNTGPEASLDSTPLGIIVESSLPSAGQETEELTYSEAARLAGTGNRSLRTWLIQLDGALRAYGYKLPKRESGGYKICWDHVDALKRAREYTRSGATRWDAIIKVLPQLRNVEKLSPSEQSYMTAAEVAFKLGISYDEMMALLRRMDQELRKNGTAIPRGAPGNACWAYRITPEIFEMIREELRKYWRTPVPEISGLMVTKTTPEAEQEVYASREVGGSQVSKSSLTPESVLGLSGENKCPTQEATASRGRETGNYKTIAEVAALLGQPPGRIAYWVNLLAKETVWWRDPIEKKGGEPILNENHVAILQRANHLYTQHGYPATKAISKAVIETYDAIKEDKETQILTSQQIAQRTGRPLVLVVDMLIAWERVARSMGLPFPRDEETGKYVLTQEGLAFFEQALKFFEQGRTVRESIIEALCHPPFPFSINFLYRSDFARDSVRETVAREDQSGCGLKNVNAVVIGEESKTQENTSRGQTALKEASACGSEPLAPESSSTKGDYKEAARSARSEGKGSRIWSLLFRRLKNEKIGDVPRTYSARKRAKRAAKAARRKYPLRWQLACFKDPRLGIKL